MTVTTAQLKSAFQMLAALAEAIRELREIPEGELYARLMDHFTHEGWDRAIGQLVRAGLVKRQAQQLIWTGPTFDEPQK